ncbi:MAG: LLM class flavin-dependent oxidoreductase, partial [Nocardioides sp.]
AEGILADEVGVDYIGLGEHHRPDFSVSAPDVVLAAIASRTQRIRLGTGVTVLSSDDPIRVYERFATLDALSNGRAEVQLGRGSFVEPFPLFGYDLSDYEMLFAEKLDLFTRLQSEGPVTWSGTHRPPVHEQRVWPTTAGGVPAWVAVGGTPQSVVRAASYGLPLMVAVIGGSPAQFAALVDLYHRVLRERGFGPRPVGMHSPGHIAETDDEAREQLYPHQAELYTRLGRERGWPPYSRLLFEQVAGPEGAHFVGSPETVATKIAWSVWTLGLSRFQLKYAVGGLSAEHKLASIRLYGEQVIPRVRELLAAATDAPPA